MTELDTTWKHLTRYPIRLVTDTDIKTVHETFNDDIVTRIDLETDIEPDIVQTAISTISLTTTPATLILRDYDSLPEDIGTDVARKLKGFAETEAGNDVLILITGTDSLTTYEPDLRGRVKTGL